MKFCSGGGSNDSGARWERNPSVDRDCGSKSMERDSLVFFSPPLTTWPWRQSQLWEVLRGAGKLNPFLSNQKTEKGGLWELESIRKIVQRKKLIEWTHNIMYEFLGSSLKQPTKGFEVWAVEWTAARLCTGHCMAHMGQSKTALQGLGKLNWHWNNSSQKVNRNLWIEPNQVDCCYNKQKFNIFQSI